MQVCLHGYCDSIPVKCLHWVVGWVIVYQSKVLVSAIDNFYNVKIVCKCVLNGISDLLPE